MIDASLLRWLAREALRSGTIAGLAMMPFGFTFRAAGYRINEYGPKTLALLIGEQPGPVAAIAGFAQHLAISWAAALPLILLAPPLATRAHRVGVGALYGAVFYVAVNSLALPLFFGDPTPWQLGAAVIAPSLCVHLVYGAVVGAMLRGRPADGSSR